MSYTVIAAAAAARQKRLMEEEEEQLTPYSHEELDDNWEFKIVRASTDLFADPQSLQQVVNEEGRSGWVLLEKFDNNRLRFKRRRGAGASLYGLNPEIDPYRSHVGVSQTTYKFRLILIMLAVLFALMGLTFAIYLWFVNPV